MKKMVVVFRNLERVNLYKQMGQLGNYFHKSPHYRVELYTHNATVETGDEWCSVPIRNHGSYWEMLKSVWKNAKEINVLILPSFGLDTHLLTFTYLSRNQKGVVTTRLDIGEKDYNDRKGLRSHHVLGKPLDVFARQLTDHFIVETEWLRKTLLQDYPSLEYKLIVAPKSVDSELMPRFDLEKENRILFVGRLDSEQKNTKAFLNVLEGMELSGWEVRMIGKLRSEDRERARQLGIKVFPYKNDRVELFKEFAQAKILCLTSKWETYPTNTMVEAMYYDCEVLTWDSMEWEDWHTTRYQDIELYRQKLQELMKQDRAVLLSKYTQGSMWGELASRIGVAVEMRS